MRNTVFFPNQTPHKIELVFHPRYSQFEPVGVAMLAAWAQAWQDAGVEIECQNLQAKGVAYAQRMGLFKFLKAELPTSVEEHEEAGRFVALQRIHKQADLTMSISPPAMTGGRRSQGSDSGRRESGS